MFCGESSPWETPAACACLRPLATCCRTRRHGKNGAGCAGRLRRPASITSCNVPHGRFSWTTCSRIVGGEAEPGRGVAVERKMECVATRFSWCRAAAAATAAAAAAVVAWCSEVLRLALVTVTGCTSPPAPLGSAASPLGDREKEV
jgi:hypothetical protein